MKKLSSDVLEQVSGAGLIRPLPFYFDKNKLPWGGVILTRVLVVILGVVITLWFHLLALSVQIF